MSKSRRQHHNYPRADEQKSRVLALADLACTEPNLYLPGLPGWRGHRPWWYGLVPPLGEVFMIRAVFGTGLLAFFSATMVSHASVETCQLRYENVVWPNCIKFQTLSDDRVNRERLHHCQTYAALWFNRCVQEAAERERRRRGYSNCGPGPRLHAGWH